MYSQVSTSKAPRPGMTDEFSVNAVRPFPRWHAEAPKKDGKCEKVGFYGEEWGRVVKQLWHECTRNPIEN